MKKYRQLLTIMPVIILVIISSINSQAAAPSLRVHLIDIGQADCILVQADNANMLIDAGNNADSNSITAYLKKQKVNSFQYIIGTHPHEDHIGSLDTIIDNYPIGRIIMPKAVATTRAFENVLNAIKNKKMKVTTPKVGDKYTLGKAVFTILAPNRPEYADLNDYSVVIKMTYGKKSFLFMGDAESVSESEILENKIPIKSDFIKIGHHGSNSSTSMDFLKAVSPGIAAISLGIGNQYGHPHKETLEKLMYMKIPVYRTDECGTVVFTCNGTTITADKKPGSYKPGD